MLGFFICLFSVDFTLSQACWVLHTDLRFYRFVQALKLFPPLCLQQDAALYRYSTVFTSGFFFFFLMSYLHCCLWLSG